MAEYKQYITQIQENGNVMISEDVIATIVSQALTEVEGIAGLNTKPVAEFTDLIGKKTWGKGLKVMIAEDNTLAIDCSVMVKYDYSVVEVARAVQQQVTNSLENRTGVKVTNVNVNICGIVRE